MYPIYFLFLVMNYLKFNNHTFLTGEEWDTLLVQCFFACLEDL